MYFINYKLLHSNISIYIDVIKRQLLFIKSNILNPKLISCLHYNNYILLDDFKLKAPTNINFIFYYLKDLIYLKYYIYNYNLVHSILKKLGLYASTLNTIILLS